MTGGWTATRGTLRVARAGTVSLVAVGTGAAAHVGAGSCLPLGAAAAGFVVVLLASWVLAATELTGPMLVTWLGVAQIFIHLVLQTACPDGHVGRGETGLLLIGHVVALIASAVALRSGETGLWCAARLTAAWRRIGTGWGLRPLAALPAPAGLPSCVTGRTDLPIPGSERVQGATGRRGPPRGLALR